ncbi:hypothetical protein QBC41DRAFT_313308 [Cercophora samala]|uniref:Secreted protein n=1 Tax=Cercophora samala TaxID=330535 RepID=A0AA40DF69_9PEZI|nr:hypothetical protein QBC41DRAFT_313308 [Cercophora samala]
MASVFFLSFCLPALVHLHMYSLPSLLDIGAFGGEDLTYLARLRYLLCSYAVLGLSPVSCDLCQSQARQAILGNAAIRTHADTTPPPLVVYSTLVHTDRG